MYEELRSKRKSQTKCARYQTEEMKARAVNVHVCLGHGSRRNNGNKKREYGNLETKNSAKASKIEENVQESNNQDEV